MWFGRWSADDERDVALFMQRLSMSAGAEPARADDVRLLWLRGQLRKRWEAERRVHAPLDVIDRLQLAAGVAIAAAVVVWALPAFV